MSAAAAAMRTRKTWKLIKAIRQGKRVERNHFGSFYRGVHWLLFLELKLLSHNLDMGNLQRSLWPSSLSFSSSSSLGSHPLQIDPELWLMADKRTQEILYTIQPAFASEHKRMEIINYIQSLLKIIFQLRSFHLVRSH